jgi:single-strand DNA-binding protein
MNNLNSVLVEGNLTKDPSLKVISTGTAVGKFTIAVNRFWKKDNEPQESVSYIDIEVWAGLAETCSQYLKKGRGVRIVGRLEQDRYILDVGTYKEKLKIVAEHVEFKPEYSKKQDKVGEEKTDDALV